MKKTAGVMILALGVIGAFPLPSAAAGPFNFYVRGGVLTDQSLTFSPFLWTVGANLDLNLSPLLVISPECDAIVHKFNFDPVWLAPAVTLNLRASGLYAGMGLAKFLVIGSGYTLSSHLLFKLNAGFKTDSFKLQIYSLSEFEDLFGSVLFGATLGFGF